MMIQIGKNPLVSMVYTNIFQRFNRYPAELFYLNFQPFEVVSRYRDPQPQVVENYLYLFNL